MIGTASNYLDLLSGWGVFAIGRNHPKVRDTLKKVARQRLSKPRSDGCVDAGGGLGRALVAPRPLSDKVFFANSGTESVEASLKFARSATGRTGIVYCKHASTACPTARSR